MKFIRKHNKKDNDTSSEKQNDNIKKVKKEKPNILSNIRKRFYDTIKKKEDIKTPDFFISKPRNIIFFNDKTEIENIDIRYPLLEPYSYARIFWNNEKNEILYYVIEPTLSKEDWKIYSNIVSSLLEIIDIHLSTIKNRSDTLKYVEQKIHKIINEYNICLTEGRYMKIMYYIYRNFIGLNEIDPFMHDPNIEDIGCDGLDVSIYIVHRKFGSIRTNIKFTDMEKLRDFVVKLAERCGRYISYAEPLLDGTLPDGSRIQASLATDVTMHGPTFSIRKFMRRPFSPINMIDNKTTNAEILAYLWFAVENGISMMIIGGVATGKTSFLNVLSMFIPPEAKIISIEDTRELQLPHENWIPSASRIGFGTPTKEGKYGEVTMFDLLKESFRQNPDYVIVGEIRGKEAYVMFQGMASGHPCMGTMHAGRVDDVIHRLETPPIELSPSLIETLDLVVVMVHAREIGKSSRRVKEIVEIEDIDQKTGEIRTNKSFVWLPSVDDFEFRGSSYILQKISKLKSVPLENLKTEILNRKKVIEWMDRKKINKFGEVSKIIYEYYKNKEKIMRMVD